MGIKTYNKLEELSRNINLINDESDRYFYGMCCAVASKSKCLSRQIGAVLVRDKIIVATGYNGPPRGFLHCNRGGKCPRQVGGYKSGEGLHLCPAVHAEVNCIASAARLGVKVKGSTMYMTCGLPCKICLGIIINAGVSELVCTSLDYYDELSYAILNQSLIDLQARVFR